MNGLIRFLKGGLLVEYVLVVLGLGCWFLCGFHGWFWFDHV